MTANLQSRSTAFLGLASLALFVAAFSTNVIVGVLSVPMLVLLYLMRTRPACQRCVRGLAVAFSLVFLMLGGLHGEAWAWQYAFIAAAIPLVWLLIVSILVPVQSTTTVHDYNTWTTGALVAFWQEGQADEVFVWADQLPRDARNRLYEGLDAARDVADRRKN
jgi:hypothetical protein